MTDAIVVGSGPNGLAAAIALAQAGVSVRVVEAAATPGGGARSAELTLPGYIHDVCSAIHPLAVASPFLAGLPLAQYGLEWVHPPAALAHPYADGTAAMLERSVTRTAATLDADAARYRRLIGPLAEDCRTLLADLLGPLRLPRHPVAVARFGGLGVLPASSLARVAFRGPRARGFFAGLAAHSMLPLSRSPSAAFGLVLAVLGHAVGWPVARGGTQRLTDALVAHLETLGGVVETGRTVGSLREVGGHRIVLLDVAPRQFLELAGDRLPAGYRRRLGRFRYGPGVCKVDWALSGPIPWAAPECSRAATVHLGGTHEEIAASERAAWRGEIAERPFVLLAQQTLFDESRAPLGGHTAWAYCHVPNGCREDLSARIEQQVERFAPGFRERIIGRATLTPLEIEAYNPNYVGGDINGGAADLRQFFTRPVARMSPYTTPLEAVFLCSSSTPPGGGVHGMCGWFAAQAALRHLRER